MLTLEAIQNFSPIGLDLNELYIVEMEAEEVEMNHYAQLGEIEEKEEVTDEENDFLVNEGSRLNAIFNKFHSKLSSAIELASL